MRKIAIATGGALIGACGPWTMLSMSSLARAARNR